MTDPTNTPAHLVKTTTGRGFAHLPPIPSEYGGHVTVSESSAADGPHVWLRATCPVDLNNPHGDAKETAMHLTADNAVRVAEQLQQTVRDHYQGWGYDGDYLGVNEPMRRALELIGTECEMFASGLCVDEPNRTPDAQHAADRWCHGCIARTALAGGELPATGGAPE
ncbi:hypothetical protein [Verrucosispora sp. WMMC514]|uniref:hypothetical protein n=1 Tax=Verrucosispora sp. WMMC514 TaxID=3015156 RepID=UPI00248B11B0|nr:hypothetical protein [Verrucosispora sp. WMMC514]WBB94112.1 hypothetical protein O7597_14785 [Verrucosispora sp. WMMC514]